ncbi:unnamed protein product [Brassica rapa subsp. trilocularis]
MLMLSMVQFMEKKSSHWIGMEIHLTNNTITLFHCGLPNEDINVDIRQIEISQLKTLYAGMPVTGIENISDINDDNAMDLLSMLCCEIFDQFMNKYFEEGVEVQAGKPLKVTPGYDSIVHISHASLGDYKGKKGEAVTFNVKEFELSHNWGKGSVHFVGFKFSLDLNVLCVFTEGGEDFYDSEEEEEVEVPATVAANGNAAKSIAKPKHVTAPVKRNADPEADDSDSEGMDEDCFDDEDDSEEEDETPKAETKRKRAHEAAPAPKTPVSAKKTKAAESTPKKTGKDNDSLKTLQTEKKKVGPATPHPAKKGGNTPATATQSPKSASQVSCGSCKKTFNSSNTLESHTKAKHSATAK